jgi:metal-responsive CopG/Arc/MetJ family transcriptional regulator
MGNAVKEKVTVSIDLALVSEVDRQVRAHRADSRSAIVEEALRFWRREQQRRQIERGVEEYYRSRSKKEAREDRAWARLASRQAKSLWND